MLPPTITATSALVELLFNDDLVGRCLVAPDGTVLRANSEWLRSTGFDLDQVLGADIVDLFPDARDMALAMHGRARAGHRVEVPRHAQVVNGRETWWEGRIEPVPMEGGTGLLITARDVSGTSVADGRHAAELLELGDPMCELDSEYRVVHVNANQERISQTPASVSVGRIFWDVWPEAARSDSRYSVEYRRCMEQRVPTQFEEHYAPLDLWTLITAYPTSSGGIAIFSRDITQQKRAEKALRESEKRQAFLLKLSDALRPLSESAAIQGEAARLLREHFDVGWCYYAEFDEDGTVAIVLRDATRHGLPSLAGRHDLTDIPEYVAFLRTGRLVDVPDFAKYELLSPRVVERYTDIGVRAMLGSALIKEGRLLAQLVMADTSPRRWPREAVDLIGEVAERTWAAVERARAEEELSRMRRRADDVNAFRVRFSDAVEGLTDPKAVATTACRMIREELGAERAYWAEVDWTSREYVVGAGYDGSEAPMIEGRFPLDAWEPFTSYHLAGRPVVVDDTQRDTRLPTAVRDAYAGLAVGADLATAVTTGGKLRATLAVNQRLPRRWTAEETGLVQDVAGRCWAAVERARAEAALRESEARLRDIDKRKTEFLAMLSHELRNPLAPIRNSIYLLERAAPGSEQATRARDVVRRQTEHLTRLVDDLLDVTRISHGKIPLERSKVDLREIVRKTTDDIHSVLSQAAINLRVDYAAFGPMWVDADPTRISQVVTNLLNNATKFTPSGGTVRVTVGAHQGYAEVCVIDSGIGMDPQDIEHMFEPFAQADQSLARTKGGLGLGLALVKSIVELHGGTVAAHSQGLGRGAEFLVRLPLVDAAAQSGTPQPVDSGTTPQTVLVIEDNVDGAQSLADILEMHGHRVRVARDGRSGIDLAREVRPDVILCDIGLPDVDGYDVARALRRDRPLRDTRLIALSGYAQPEDRQRARDAGFDAHLAKPVELDALLAVLAKDS